MWPYLNTLTSVEERVIEIRSHINHIPMPTIHKIQNAMTCLTWWHTPLIPALGKQRQVDFWVQGQPGLQSEFQDSQGYIEKPCLEKTKTKTKQNKTKTSMHIK